MKRKILDVAKYIGIFILGALVMGYIFELSTYLDPHMRQDIWLRNILIFCWGMMCLISILSKDENEIKKFSADDMVKASKYGYDFHKTTSFPEQKFEDSCVNNTKQWLTTFKKNYEV